MNVVVYSVNQWEYFETVRTTSNVIVLDGDTILLDGGVRVHLGNPIGLVFNSQTGKVTHLSRRFLKELTSRGYSFTEFMEECKNEQETKKDRPIDVHWR